MYSTTLLLALLPALGTALPSPTSADDAAAAAVNSCVYSTLPSATAYAAQMTNPKLTAAQIDTFFTQFSFACEESDNFKANLMSNGAWFGANEYTGETAKTCNATNFQPLVDQCLMYQRQGSYNVQCTKFKAGGTDAFSKAAKNYFASLK